MIPLLPPVDLKRELSAPSLVERFKRIRKTRPCVEEAVIRYLQGNMTVIGLDVGRNHAVAAALDHYPINLKRYYNAHRREFVRINFDAEGFISFWEMNPTVVILEPTGGWYSRLIAEKCHAAGVEVCWVGHADLKAIRESHGFKNKRDPEDALCLAATYFDDRFVDEFGRKRFLHFDERIQQLEDWFYELEQLDKVKTALVNQLRQRLCYEFPEVAQKRTSDTSINKKLGCHPFWAALAGIHTYAWYRKTLNASVGAGLSDYSKNHAARICELEQQSQALESLMSEFIAAPEFEPYLRAFEPFRFGLRNISYLLCKIYPFEKFLINNKPWVSYGRSKKGKRVRNDHSCRQFQAFLGLSYTLEKSGDSGNLKKKFHGSKVCRSHLYCWVKTRFDMERGKLLESEQARALWEKYQQLRKLYQADNGKWRNGEDTIGGDDAVIRILFKTTSDLYKNLKHELIR